MLIRMAETQVGSQHFIPCSWYHDPALRALRCFSAHHIPLDPPIPFHPCYQFIVSRLPNIIFFYLSTVSADR